MNDCRFSNYDIYVWFALVINAVFDEAIQVAKSFFLLFLLYFEGADFFGSVFVLCLVY
jgi:hypothetical protein